MFYSAILFVVASLSTSVLAQTSPSGGSPYTLNAAEIAALPVLTRDQWCVAQRNTCLQVCGSGGAYPNTCDTTTLEWTCTCGSGAKPDISSYVQSVPAQLCLAYVNQCVMDNTQSAAAQQKCRNTPCGSKIAMNPTPTTAASKTSATMKTTTSQRNAGQRSSTASAAANSPTSTGAAIALNTRSSSGVAGFALGLLTMFKMFM